MKMKKLIAPALALGVLGGGIYATMDKEPVKYVQTPDRLDMYRARKQRLENMPKEAAKDPKGFVQRYGNADYVGSEEFDVAVNVATRRGLVLEDSTYNQLVDSINNRYGGYVACYAEYPEGARGQSCKGKLEKLQSLHSDMNYRREKAKKKTIPLTDIPELRLYR